MTQKELSEKIGLTDQHRIVQYEKGVRVPKKDLVDKMAQALDVNPYTLYDTAGRDASEMMELLFWLDEFNPSALHLFLPRQFPGEKCNEQALSASSQTAYSRLSGYSLATTSLPI